MGFILAPFKAVIAATKAAFFLVAIACILYTGCDLHAKWTSNPTAQFLVKMLVSSSPRERLLP
jgi:hypothetical protein